MIFQISYRIFHAIKISDLAEFNQAAWKQDPKIEETPRRWRFAGFNMQNVFMNPAETLSSVPSFRCKATWIPLQVSKQCHLQCDV